MRTFLFSAVVFLICATAGTSEISAQTKGGKSDNLFHRDLDYAQVVFVRAVQTAKNTWRFETTVRHNDEGWEHYADAWQIVNPISGTVIAERVLLHPHDQEQPFTRSLSDVSIPSQLKRVVLRARCNIHGFGGREVEVDLEVKKGEYFEVIR
jgi:hypothetical protein